MMATYNGWANWQTWNVNLWVLNEEGPYLLVKERARQLRRRWSATDAKEFVLDIFPDGTPDMDGPHEYRGVRWLEIARSFDEVGR